MRAPDFWDRKTDGLLPTILRPLGCMVAGINAMRRRTIQPWQAPVPVICVGNLVAGGAGKTPVVIDIVARLRGRGIDVHVVSRGYGGSELGPLLVNPDIHDHTQVGDEPLLIARTALTWVAKERRQGIEAAAAAGAQIVVMDDGYQNPSVAKDFSILVVDGGYGFGNGRVMPAGPLRERIPEGLARADMVVLLGADEADVWGRIQRLGFKNLDVLRAKLTPLGNVAALKGQSVYAFAGIGRPEKFYDTLEKLGCKLAGCKSFDDHHPYTDAEILTILSEALDVPVYTTAKDHVRLSPHHQKRVRVLGVEVTWKDENAICSVLMPLIENLKSDESLKSDD